MEGHPLCYAPVPVEGLSGIAVNDLALFARIQMARGLLGMPDSNPLHQCPLPG